VHAGPNPKYFGIGRGVTYYNLVSDQFTGLHGITVPGTLRDSLVLLAVVLEQQTELQPTQIMTDTGAYSDVVFGRIDKTIHTLTYLDDETKRRATLIQLNRGEGRHSLARAVFHGKRGELRQRYREGQEDQLGALGLVVNMIVLWNTIYMQAALEQLRAEDYSVREEDVVRLSPLGHEHINLLGRYSFAVPEAVARGELRPLRNPADSDRLRLSTPKAMRTWTARSGSALSRRRYYMVEDTMQRKEKPANERSQFTPNSLARVLEQINASVPEQLETDWRTFVHDAFLLEPEQKRSLDRVPESRVKEIQTFFANAAVHIKKGGKLHARIIKRPVEKRTQHVVHELHMDTDSSAITPKLGIVIAHCDAHCKNWGWGPG